MPIHHGALLLIPEELISHITSLIRKRRSPPPIPLVVVLKEEGNAMMGKVGALQNLT